MVRSEKSTLTGIAVQNSSGTERDICNATGNLYNVGKQMPSYAFAAIGNDASPTYTGWQYKFVYKNATYRKASKHFLFDDLKTVVWGTAQIMVSGASVAARKPGAPLSFAGYYTSAATTTAGATLRLFGIMANGAAASNAAAVRCKVLALGKV